MRALPVLHSDALASPKEPVGAVLTAGRRDTRGYVIDASKGRFYIGLPIGASKKARRKLHPDYEPFNSTPAPRAADEAHPAATIRGLVVHADIGEAYNLQRRAHRGPKNDKRVANPAHNGPWCYGDEVTARRWDGRDYQEIECPGDDCPFAQGSRPSCVKGITIHFYPRWDGTRWADAGMRQVLTRWRSSGRGARDSWMGLLRHVRHQAETMGIELTSWYGLPFQVTQDFATGPSGKYTQFQVSTDGDLMAWLLAQRRQVAQLTGGPAPLGLLDSAAHEPDLMGDDAEATLEHVVPVARPSATAEPEEPEPEPEDVLDVTPVDGGQVELFNREAQGKAEAALRMVGTLDDFAEIHGPPDTWGEEDIEAARAAYREAKAAKK